MYIGVADTGHSYVDETVSWLELRGRGYRDVGLDLERLLERGYNRGALSGRDVRHIRYIPERQMRGGTARDNSTALYLYVKERTPGLLLGLEAYCMDGMISP